MFVIDDHLVWINRPCENRIEVASYVASSPPLFPAGGKSDLFNDISVVLDGLLCPTLEKVTMDRYLDIPDHE